jgi:hypothetical protein
MIQWLSGFMDNLEAMSGTGSGGGKHFFKGIGADLAGTACSCQ